MPEVTWYPLLNSPPASCLPCTQYITTQLGGRNPCVLCFSVPSYLIFFDIFPYEMVSGIPCVLNSYNTGELFELLFCVWPKNLTVHPAGTSTKLTSRINGMTTHDTHDTLYHRWCCCVCVCCHPINSGRQACGRTSRGHTGGRSRRISPPSFCGVALIFLSRRIQPFPRRP